MEDKQQQEVLISDLMLGHAAEHIVCTNLIMSGYKAFLTEQICPYDIVVEVNDKLLRVQVKATRKYKRTPQRVGHYPSYIWRVKRAGKGGKRHYSNTEFDRLALVAVDTRQIAYMLCTETKLTVTIRPDFAPNKSSSKVFSDFTFDKLLSRMSDKEVCFGL